MSLASLPLTSRTLRIGDGSITIETVTDQDALLRDLGDRDILPFGLMLWESAVVLAQTLTQMRLSNRRVLELGAGIGLAGLAAAKSGAIVAQTDIDPLALDLCQRNAAANGVHARVSTAILDWHHRQPTETYDVVLGADILYDRADHAAVARLLDDVVAPAGVALLTDPSRPHTSSFLDNLDPACWTVSVETVASPNLTDPTRHVMVQIYTLQRSS